MKTNTKSSVTLSAEMFATVQTIRRRLGAKSNVAVIRQGLHLLKERIDREALRSAYRLAAKSIQDSTVQEIEELDHLTAESLDA